MNYRQRVLSAGWYPQNKYNTINKIEEFKSQFSLMQKNIFGGIVPHAGWEFSGKAALQVFLTCLDIPETCVIVGGHLSSRQGILAADEDEYETPLGNLVLDKELLKTLQHEIPLAPDLYSDNTVEIQLPLVKYCYPEAKLLWLRAGTSLQAIELGKALYSCAGKLQKHILVFGSTDLTHYGSNYGFEPLQSRGNPIEWVKTINDKRIIDAMIALDCNGILNTAEKDTSACSAGGAAAAASFAKESGAIFGELLSYYTSHDVYPLGDSFVGYAAIIFPGNKLLFS